MRAEPLAYHIPATSDRRQPANVVLLGPGQVGGRLLDRIAAADDGTLRLVALANSRRMCMDISGLDLADWRRALDGATEDSDLNRLETWVARHAARSLIVDATGDAAVGARHTRWLAAGWTVVTANKWAAAGEGAAALEAAAERATAGYWYSTTVGAGLPVLHALRGLRLAGDPVTSIAGVFSGTVSHLLHGVRAGLSFADCVLQACRDGLTEPDPRLDLSGLDVARKLVIAARAAGVPLGLDQVELTGVLPPYALSGSLASFLARPEEINRAWARALNAAGSGEMPCYLARLDASGAARVSLCRLPAGHVLADAGSAENVVMIHSRTYDRQPLVIRGPGAGSEATAMQLLADLRRACGQNATRARARQ